ncbi:MAG: hypothetical protein M3Y30_06745, partial [Gemmatimonadota bacterium]|nr:hypothetical protein [Gemmatimonadota bacterium]
MRTRLPSLVLGSSIVIYLAACGSDSSGPPNPNGVCSGATFTVPVLQGQVIAQSDLPCLSIPADGSTYLVVPQFVTATAGVNLVDFTLTAAAAGATANIVSASRHSAPTLSGTTADLGQAQRTFEGMLRRRERAVAAAALSSGTAAVAAASVIHADAAPPVLGSSLPFHVLSDFSNNTYTTDTATLKYVGTHLLIYVSKNA